MLDCGILSVGKDSQHCLEVKLGRDAPDLQLKNARRQQYLTRWRTSRTEHLDSLITA